ncbi:MAG: TadE/TadG family type IV pilus assembly protein [Pseudorhodoplanes sp.]
MLDKFKARCARRLKLGVVRRFRGEEDGATAVEFALISVPFLALLLGIIETAGVFFAGQTLETATADSARLILTGQAQSQGLTQAQFKTAVCSRVYGLFDCASNMYVDVKTYSSFSNIDNTKPIDANGNLVNNFTYQPGGPGCIVVVRLLYAWPVYVSLMGLNIADMNGRKRLLVATAAFRNEPYAQNGGC